MWDGWWLCVGWLVVRCGMVGGYVWDGWWLGKIGCSWSRGDMLPGDKLSLPMWMQG